MAKNFALSILGDGAWIQNIVLMVFNSDRAMDNYAHSPIKKDELPRLEYLWLNFPQKLGECLNVKPFEKGLISEHVENYHPILASVDVAISSQVA